MVDRLEDRIIELETRLAYQEDTLQQLNQVVTEQDQMILRLQEHMRLVADKLISIEGGVELGGGMPVNERPPHY